MPSTTITTEGLGKRYRIGALREQRDTIRDQLVHSASSAARHLRMMVGGDASERHAERTIWALKDVSMSVEEGEVVGIIGRNGAGKTTLLKILSRITEPTEGRARIAGRVGSLLEVGTGFHPELTGRENVYLNGAILGMRRAEIRGRFDDIVEFADVARFIETPVKRYSSGMTIRLAFAVAAFLEPEVLLIDEVLAVGDSAFQQKCIGKMGSVAREGRTVLVVSHNMGVVNQLCHRAVWLDAGRIRDAGDTAPIVRAYLHESDAGHSRDTVAFPERPEQDSQTVGVRLLNEEGVPTGRFTCDEPVMIEIDYLVRRPVNSLWGNVEIDSADGTPVLVSYSYDVVPNPLDRLAAGVHTLRVPIPPRSLAPGDYRVTFFTARGMKGTVSVDSPGVICTFALDDTSSLRGNRRLGYFSTLLDWDVVRVTAAERSTEVA
jgi:lipopolysaccharide transport system ATP-binding protein